MTLRYSDAARNFIMGRGSYRDAFNNGRIEIYSGSQPASANAAVTGTLLCTITAASGARTAETLATGTVTLTGGASGSINTLTVNGIDVIGGAVPFNTSLNQTAADLATKINNFRGQVGYTASAAGAVVTITALPGSGTGPNGFVVTGSNTTITTTYGNMSGGVSAANGLLFSAAGIATVGMVSKLSTQSWSGVNAASGTAGYYRLYGSVADTGLLDSTATYVREDGAIATASVELNMASTAFTNGATTTISQWDRTLPTL